jgi:hypothetical protein
VFATSKGTPLDAQNILNRHFKPLLKRAGLPNIRWHDLRHTYATLLLARGTHPTYVQKSLGHASVQLTLDRYSHWMPRHGPQHRRRDRRGVGLELPYSCPSLLVDAVSGRSHSETCAGCMVPVTTPTRSSSKASRSVSSLSLTEKSSRVFLASYFLR